MKRIGKKRIKYLIYKYWYTFLKKIGLHKPISAEEMKRAFIEMFNEHKETNAFDKQLDKAQETMVNNRLNNLD